MTIKGALEEDSKLTNIEVLRQLLETLRLLSSTHLKDENLFQIGGRGHYENPTTQLLEFFLSSSRCHGFGTQVLDILLSMVGVEWDTQLEYSTRLEVAIDEDGAKGRLDLVLEASSWIVVIEDKIRHQAVNDFGAYGSWAKSQGKQHMLLILLSVRDEPAPQGWKVVRWLDLIQAIRARLGLNSNWATLGKWSLFLEEFLANVEIECNGGRMMDEERFKFALENAGSLIMAQELYQEFLKDICSRWKVELEGRVGKVRDARIEGVWKDKGGGWSCHPIRFLLSKPDLEIVLKVTKSGFGINLYLQLGIGHTIESVKEHLRMVDPVPRVDTERGYIACIITDSADLSLNAALTWACLAIEQLRSR